jgi:hypothetical protein
LSLGLAVVHLPSCPISIEGFESAEVVRVIRFRFKVVVKVTWVTPYDFRGSDVEADADVEAEVEVDTIGGLGTRILLVTYIQRPLAASEASASMAHCW